MVNQSGTEIPEEILKKIANLFKKAESTHSIHESQTAISLAQKLMEKHQITKASLNLSGEAKDEPIINWADKDMPIDSARATWAVRLANGLSKFHGCMVYTMRSKEGKGKDLHIIGRESDAQEFYFIYEFVKKEIDKLTIYNGTGYGRTWCNNYRIGCVEGFISKMKETREQTREELKREVSSNPNALMVLTNAIQIVDNKLMEVNKFASQNMRFRYDSRPQGAYNPNAREQGFQDGRTINPGKNRNLLN